jgi:hypothetical protein
VRDVSLRQAVLDALPAGSNEQRFRAQVVELLLGDDVQMASLVDVDVGGLYGDDCAVLERQVLSIHYFP